MPQPPFTLTESDAHRAHPTDATLGPSDGGEGPLAPADIDSCAAEVLEVMPAVMDAMRTAMRRQVGEQLSVPQFRCLNFITQRPGSSVSAVAAFLGVTVPTASAIVDRLVRSGAVALTTAAADRRRSELHVTAAGRAHIDHIRGGARVEFARALASCNPAELHALRSGLDVLRRVFLPV